MESDSTGLTESLSFPVPGLWGLPSRRIVLSQISARLRRIPECGIWSESLHARLTESHDAVAMHEDEHWRAEYCDVLTRFVKLLRRTPLLERLAGADSIAYSFRELNSKLDEICAGIGLIDASARGQWEEEWGHGRDFQAHQLEERVASAATRMLIAEMRGDTQVTRVLVDMYSSLEGNTSGPLTELKRVTLERMRVDLGLEIRHLSAQEPTPDEANSSTVLYMFRWYIPERDVELADAAPIVDGSYGTVNRGTWRRRDGVIQNVVVKLLDKMISEESFLRQLQLWYELPKHRNILRLFGGSHLAKRKFFVCEDAPGSDIVQFLSDEDDRGLLWSMFIEVAEGLKVLYDHHIVHNGLRGSSILIGADNTPKISDFDWSRIRAVSSSFSQTAEAAMTMTSLIRWTPRERLLGSVDDDQMHYKSDIYALGMCIIEAMTHCIPFGDVDDVDVMKKIIAGEPFKRPPEASDKEWGVISRLIAANIDERPDIDETIALLRSLGTIVSLDTDVLEERADADTNIVDATSFQSQSPEVKMSTAVASSVVPNVESTVPEVLDSIQLLCRQLGENEEICTAVYKRLVILSEELSKNSELSQSHVLFTYDQTLASFHQFLGLFHLRITGIRIAGDIPPA